MAQALFDVDFKPLKKIDPFQTPFLDEPNLFLLWNSLLHGLTDTDLKSIKKKWCLVLFPVSLLKDHDFNLILFVYQGSLDPLIFHRNALDRSERYIVLCQFSGNLKFFPRLPKFKVIKNPWSSGWKFQTVQEIFCPFFYSFLGEHFFYFYIFEHYIQLQTSQIKKKNK